MRPATPVHSWRSEALQASRSMPAKTSQHAQCSTHQIQTAAAQQQPTQYRPCQLGRPTAPSQLPVSASAVTSAALTTAMRLASTCTSLLKSCLQSQCPQFVEVQTSARVLARCSVWQQMWRALRLIHSGCLQLQQQQDLCQSCLSADSPGAYVTSLRLA